MKPILFNTEMVRAILDGRKTQTRRVVKFPEGMTGRLPPGGANYYLYYPGGIKYPPYHKGDMLWVRETWTSENGAFYYRADFASDFLDPCETLSGGYPGDCAYHPGCEGCARGPQRIRWRPSIHMPKEAARLFLRVTDVRVERLQDISPRDIKKEGIVAEKRGDEFDYEASPEVMDRFAFEEVWDSTIKPADLDRYGWDANPWVWVYTFKRCGKEGE